MSHKSKHYTSNLSIHLIFVVKYRKQLLIKYGNEIKELLTKRAEMSDSFSIKEIEVDKDHAHMLIDYIPSEPISNIVKQLKSHSTFHIWEKYGKELSNQFWKRKMFWSPSYYVSSVGEVNREIVENYIKEQGTRPQTIHPRS
jgi:putative transposase